MGYSHKPPLSICCKRSTPFFFSSFNAQAAAPPFPSLMQDLASNLAVNVVYINQKLAVAAVALKEGSIASPFIKIPWKVQNFEIELEELELVLAPFMGNKIQVFNTYPKSSSADKHQMSLGLEKNEPGTYRESNGSILLDIHKELRQLLKL